MLFLLTVGIGECGCGVGCHGGTFVQSFVGIGHLVHDLKCAFYGRHQGLKYDFCLTQSIVVCYSVS